MTPTGVWRYREYAGFCVVKGFSSHPRYAPSPGPHAGPPCGDLLLEQRWMSKLNARVLIGRACVSRSRKLPVRLRCAAVESPPSSSRDRPQPSNGLCNFLAARYMPTCVRDGPVQRAARKMWTLHACECRTSSRKSTTVEGRASTGSQNNQNSLLSASSLRKRLF